MKLLIYGSYGNNNVGEDAVLEGILEKFKDYEITVISNNPTLTKACYNVDSKLRNNIKIKDYDKLLVGGCGIFYFGKWSLPFAKLILLAKSKDIEVEIFNVEVGPITEDDTFEAVKEAFQIADKVSVRVNFSEVILRKAMGLNRQIPVERDVSCNLKVPDCSKLIESIYGSGPYLGLSLKVDSNYWPNIIKLVKNYLEDDFKIIPIFNAYSIFRQRQDILGFNQFEEAIEQTYNKWKAPILPPLVTMGVVKCMDEIISQTVHTTIWGNYYGKKVISLVPQNKFHPMAFKQLGASEIFYCTEPEYKETNSKWMDYRGIDWEKEEEKWK